MDKSYSRLFQMNAMRGRNGNMVEFPVALFILFSFALFPLINLIGIALGAGTVGLMTVQLASRASVQQTYAQALSSMLAESQRFSRSGFANFLKVKPIGGYQNCGANLYVQATNYNAGGTLTFGPNSAVSASIDPSSYVYEYSVQTTFAVGPFISMSNVPWISSVPGVGRAAQLKWSAARAVEYVNGVSAASAASSVDNVPFIQLGSLPPASSSSGNGSPGTGSPGWNNPTIYDQIAAAGQTIVAQNVFVVPGDSNTFTSSGITVTPNENVWIDTNAVGTWGVNSQTEGAYTANGTTPNGTSGVWDSYLGTENNSGGMSGWLSLIGYMGGPPPPVNSGSTGQSYEDLPGNQVELVTVPYGRPTGITYSGQFFQVGTTLTNYQITAPGPLNFIMNNQNNLNQGTGEQWVRIIVTMKQSS